MEGRIDELLVRSTDDSMRSDIVGTFIMARLMIPSQTSCPDPTHASKTIDLFKRRVELMGKMERFRDQAKCMCDLSQSLVDAGQRKEAESYLQRARKVGEAHGFYSAEYESCQGNLQNSTLNFQPSTLNPQPSTLDLEPSTLNPQPTTLNPKP